MGGWVGWAPGSGAPKSCVLSHRTQDGSEFLLQAKDEVRSVPFSPYSNLRNHLAGWLAPGPE